MRVPFLGLALSARLLGVALCVAALAPGLSTAWAGPSDVSVPDVLGRSPEEARTLLEGAGFTVVLVPVAGPPAGRVERQEPPAGALLPIGAQVVLRYGIALRIDTRAPDVRGRLLSEVGPELEGAYVLEVELVSLPGSSDGRIVEQAPAATQALLYRGVLMLRVVQNQGPGGGAVVVPALVGRTEADALDQLKALGLNAAVDRRDDPAQPPGTVLMQDPRSGVEMIPGGTVMLRVAGVGAPPPPASIEVPVPNLKGLDMNVALYALQATGFVPQVMLQQAGGYAPWTCFQQDPPAGTPRPQGSAVQVWIALAGPAVQQVTMPTLFGLTQGQAVQILSAMGLNAQVQVEASAFPAGLVFSQDPPSGVQVQKGTHVKLRVAQNVPGPANPPSAHVPSVLGLPGALAFQKIQQAGLTPKAQHHLAPNEPVDVVDAQQPAAQAHVPLGTQVRYFVPLASVVPGLLNKTRTEAIQLLQAAGFNPQPSGPNFGMGSTIVIAQGAPAGVPLARGSTVPFAFKFQGGGPIPVKVAVPNVVGGSKNDAVNALQAKNLGVDLHHQGPNLPGPHPTQVVSQQPPAGTLVSPGTVVHVNYVEVAGPQVGTQVPTIVGMLLEQAQSALQAKGLVGQFQQQGPAFPGKPRKVVAQNVPGGQTVAVGPTVIVTFVYELILQPQAVSVPQLVGLTKAQAKAALDALGLGYNFTGPGGNPNKLRVVLQAPSKGTQVGAGSTVTLVVIPF